MVLVAQHCECTLCHPIVHLKMVNFYYMNLISTIDKIIPLFSIHRENLQECILRIFFKLENNIILVIKCPKKNSFRLAVESVADQHSHCFWPIKLLTLFSVTHNLFTICILQKHKGKR